VADVEKLKALDAKKKGKRVTSRKKSSVTLKQRCINLMKKKGWLCDDAEKRIPGTFITRDLFGVADVAAIEPGVPGTLYVNACPTGKIVKHIDEYRGKKKREMRALLEGNRFEVWGWKKAKSGRYELTRKALKVVAKRIVVRDVE
jgi:hypothetical protein